MATQVFFAQGVGNTGNSGVGYNSPTRPGAWTNIELAGSFRMPCAGTFRHWKILLDAAPGAGKSRSFIISKNGSDTALSIVIADTDVSGSDLTHSISFSAGDRVAVKHDPDATPTPAIASWILEFEPDEPGDSVYGCTTASADDGTGTWNVNPLTGIPDTTSAFPIAGVIASPGVVTGYTVQLNTALNGGTSREYSIYKNGVRQDGSGGTVDTRGTISGGTTTLDQTFSLAVVEGDWLYVEVDCTGSTGAKRPSYAMCIRTTNPDHFNIFGGTNIAASTGATQYVHPQNWPTSVNPWKTTESDAETTITPVTTVVLSRLQVALSTAPTAGRSYEFSVRVNEASPAGSLSVTIADGATTEFDATNSNTVTDADFWDLRNIPAGSPVVSSRIWALIGSAVPVESGSPGSPSGSPGGSPVPDGVIGPLVWVEWPRRIPDDDPPGSPS